MNLKIKLCTIFYRETCYNVVYIHTQIHSKIYIDLKQ